MTYRTAGTEIIYEVLDDEVIIANLDAGIYYSIRGGGTLIWQMLLSGYTIPSIESLLTEKYGSIPEISSFVDHLLTENLLVAQKDSPLVHTSIFWPSTFSVPLLERYDEMKNLLMLDPIHEVDEQGWPNRK